MRRDPAADGPEVKIITFFRMYPEGSHSRRVKNVTDKEMDIRFMLHQEFERVRAKHLKSMGRKNAKSSSVGSRRVVSSAS
jgi:hypothetical protein